MMTSMARTMPRGRNLKGTREAKYFYLFISPWLIGLIVFTAGPIIAAMALSLTDYSVIMDTEFVGLRNYVEMFSLDQLFWTSLGNTVYYTLLSVPLSMLTALCLALLLNQKVKGMAVFRTIFYLPSIVPVVAMAIIWIWMLQPRFGLVNLFLGLFGIRGPEWLGDPRWSKPALILMSLWGSGGSMIIYLAGLQGIPQQLYEAAELDGANVFQRFAHITLPMLTPTLFFTLIMGIIGSFQTFTQAYIMTGGGPVNSTLFYVLYLYRQAFEYFRMGYASAMAWVLFVVIFVLTLLIVGSGKHWVYYEADTNRGG